MHKVLALTMCLLPAWVPCIFEKLVATVFVEDFSFVQNILEGNKIELIYEVTYILARHLLYYLYYYRYRRCLGSG